MDCTTNTQLSLVNRDEAEAAIRLLVHALHRAVDIQRGSGATFEEREVKALELANEAVRRALQQDLQAIADSHADEVVARGVCYRRHQPGTIKYHSLCGPLEVTRATYRQVGVHNGPTIVPLDLATGMID